jgi:hypothetical protein
VLPPLLGDRDGIKGDRYLRPGYHQAKKSSGPTRPGYVETTPSELTQDQIDKAQERLRDGWQDYYNKHYTVYPPIESIGHTVDFIVTMNAGVTPTWSLVKFKGPGGGTSTSGNGTSGGTSGTSGSTGGGSNGSSGSFLFMSRQDTHRLQITMGPSASRQPESRDGRRYLETPQAETIPGTPISPEVDRQRFYNLEQQLLNALTPK